MAKNVRKLLEKTPKDEAVSARDKISGSRFPSSVSAQGSICISYDPI